MDGEGQTMTLVAELYLLLIAIGIAYCAGFLWEISKSLKKITDDESTTEPPQP